MTNQQNARTLLRQQLRQRRTSLSLSEQQSASDALLHNVTALPQWKSANFIASYLANDGEIDLSNVMHHAWQQKRHTTLPVIHPFSPKHLLFLRFTPTTLLVKNRFNIDEPALACPSVVPLQEHDIILMPLVGFDEAGNRLGMGGGFYDRALASFRNKSKRPWLVGTAHDCQCVEHLPVAPWDVPLDVIVTPTRVISPT
ncbi:5-formyltetrahydrofolate cyclo-ligase [Alteromonas sp. C1M14]|uniref:5-formyltetrahydrofolate cyclo-ligase n=1 Tax=Alteromonas sp. C1M14 TaxID=2841567 RepID=UPI0020904244|nr:5-formyltetrahydrofolate cyclo-ligase [Alteromonas sp. C1M14]